MASLKFYYSMVIADMESRSRPGDATASVEGLRDVLEANRTFERDILPKLPPTDASVDIVAMHYTMTVRSLACVLGEENI